MPVGLCQTASALLSTDNNCHPNHQRCLILDHWINSLFCPGGAESMICSEGSWCFCYLCRRRWAFHRVCSLRCPRHSRHARITTHSGACLMQRRATALSCRGLESLRHLPSSISVIRRSCFPLRASVQVSNIHFTAVKANQFVGRSCFSKWFHLEAEVVQWGLSRARQTLRKCRRSCHRGLAKSGLSLQGHSKQSAALARWALFHRWWIRCPWPFLTSARPSISTLSSFPLGPWCPIDLK